VSLVQNEQVKLTATYLNGVAITMFAVGGLAPVVALVSGSTLSASPAGTMALTLVCVSVSLALHVLGRWFLRGLQP
jgi:hypothetical protein